MIHRLVTSMGVVALFAAFTLLPAVPIAAQAPKAAAGKWTAPKTPWGDPDLQGIWNSGTSTPLQRPAELGEKLVLTQEEAEEYAEQLAENLNRDRRDGSPEADVDRAYNEHWMDAQRLKATADRRSSLIIDPPNGRIPPLVAMTPEEKQKRDAHMAVQRRRFTDSYKAETYLDWTLAQRCLTRTDSPPYLPTIYNNTQHIFQSPGYVTILVEMVHSSRVIPVDGRPHIGKDLKQWLGDTRGHWEGNTLVVETTNFRTDAGVIFEEANPETYKIVERFTRVSPDQLDYEFTISDPKLWTRPWAARIPWNKTDDQLYEYACHEDNYDSVHLLKLARAAEKAAAEKAAAAAAGK
jgi:hypothetical protein